jgi:hypothetical protein
MGFCPQIALLIMLTVTMVPIMQYQAPADYSVSLLSHLAMYLQAC